MPPGRATWQASRCGGTLLPGCRRRAAGWATETPASTFGVEGAWQESHVMTFTFMSCEN